MFWELIHVGKFPLQIWYALWIISSYESRSHKDSLSILSLLPPMQIQGSIHTHTQAHAHICISAHSYTRIHIHTCKHTQNTKTHTLIYKYTIHIHTHKLIHIHTYAHTWIHIRTPIGMYTHSGYWGIYWCWSTCIQCGLTWWLQQILFDLLRSVLDLLAYNVLLMTIKQWTQNEGHI